MPEVVIELVNVACDDNVAVIEVVVTDSLNGLHTKGRGTARRAKGDIPDSALGLELALGRALNNTAHHLLKRTDGRIRNGDWVVRQKALNKDRPRNTHHHQPGTNSTKPAPVTV